MKCTKLTLASVLLTLAFNAFATNWQQVTSNTFVDADTLAVSGVSTVNAWVMINRTLAERSPEDKNVASVKGLLTVLCQKRLYSHVSTIHYSGFNGQGYVIFEARDVNSRFLTVIPDTRTETIYNYLCQGK